jgi:hypothetical protein
MSLAASGHRTAGPLYGAEDLIALARELNKAPDVLVMFADDPDPRIGPKALAMLEEAERKRRVTTDAVTGHDPRTGITYIAFRHPRVRRAEVLEELRHLDYARQGKWFDSTPQLNANQMRELDNALYFDGLLAEGKIIQAEFDETVRNLAHHLSEGRQPVTEAEALALIRRIAAL